MGVLKILLGLAGRRAQQTQAVFEITVKSRFPAHRCGQEEPAVPIDSVFCWLLVNYRAGGRERIEGYVERTSGCEGSRNWDRPVVNREQFTVIADGTDTTAQPRHSAGVEIDKGDETGWHRILKPSLIV